MSGTTSGPMYVRSVPLAFWKKRYVGGSSKAQGQRHRAVFTRADLSGGLGGETAEVGLPSCSRHGGAIEQSGPRPGSHARAILCPGQGSDIAVLYGALRGYFVPLVSGVRLYGCLARAGGSRCAIRIRLCSRRDRVACEKEA